MLYGKVAKLTIPEGLKLKMKIKTRLSVKTLGMSPASGVTIKNITKEVAASDSVCKVLIAQIKLVPKLTQNVFLFIGPAK